MPVAREGAGGSAGSAGVAMAGPGRSGDVLQPGASDAMLAVVTVLFNAWLDAPLWAILAALALGFGATGWMWHALLFRWPGRALAQGLAGVAPPLFGTVGLLFSLLSGFVASDTWDTQRRAGRGVQTERDAVAALQILSESTQPVPEDAALRLALREYVAAVVDDEWPSMTGQRSAVRADAAVSGLLRVAASPGLAAQVGPVAQGAMLDLVQVLRGARNERLAISTGHYDGMKWAAVLSLALLAQVALALVHLDGSRAHVAALAVFTAAAVLVLGLLAVRERPFDGAYALPDTPLRQLLPGLPPA